MLLVVIEVRFCLQASMHILVLATCQLDSPFFGLIIELEFPESQKHRLC